MRAPLRHGFLALIPAMLLSIVAAAQVRLTRTEQLTPWKGGGFGMFSTTDDGVGRPMAIRVSGPAGDRDIGVPEPLAEEAYRASLLPSRRRLSGLAREVAALVSSGESEVTHVRIAVWRMSYDPRTLSAQPAVVRDLVVDVRHSER
ncbi:MAG TPA: hypothetical protein VJ788_10020 [Gemmatimonadota bacterium]|nr:hypothetical protein [Gemmatimonadota bacterium]